MNILYWFGEAIIWFGEAIFVFLAMFGSVFWAIFGVVVGWGLSHCSAKKLAHDHAKREAGRRLRAAFSKAHLTMSIELQREKDIKPEQPPVAMGHILMSLKEDVPKQNMTVLEFSYYLSSKERCQLKDIWKRYSMPENYLECSEGTIWDAYGASQLKAMADDMYAILAFTEDAQSKGMLNWLCSLCKNCA